jgi:hypothetical protein
MVKVKPLWTTNVHLKVEEQECSGAETSGRGGEGEWIWSMYFIYLYENRTMKPAENVLRSEEVGGGGTMEGVNLTKVYCKHICKCHNETPLCN